MKYGNAAFIIVILSVLALSACMNPASIQSEPPAMARGVAQGLKTTGSDFNSLKSEGIFIADSREGTHVIIPADKLFIRTLPRPVLAPDYLVTLNHLVDLLKEYPHVKFAVVGYTDSTLNPRMRSELSLAYAQTLANFLGAAGISPARMREVRGEGDRHPIVEGHDFRARQINRRVEVIVNAPLQ